MKRKFSIFSLSFIFLIICRTESLNAQTVIDLETGVVSTGYNDVRIPGDEGTLISLKEDLTATPKIFYRVKVNYTINTRHTLSLLLAPLTINSNGEVPYEINFAGVIFPANTKLSGCYKFNSYRLTYRYEFVKSPKLDFGLGFTAKIRDAKIAIKSTGLSGEKTDLGFVPVINFRLFWRFDENLGLLLDGDALAAKQGRAEDVLIAATYRISDHFGLKAGYRILEGGADNNTVYTFALFHYASLGLFISL